MFGIGNSYNRTYHVMIYYRSYIDERKLCWAELLRGIASRNVTAHKDLSFEKAWFKKKKGRLRLSMEMMRKYCGLHVVHMLKTQPFLPIGALFVEYSQKKEVKGDNVAINFLFVMYIFS